MGKTRKEMRLEIEEIYSGIPGKQISTGIYIDKVGTKYVHIINTWEKTTSEKILIEDFCINI